jgi:hypothetical protein
LLLQSCLCWRWWAQVGCDARILKCRKLRQLQPQWLPWCNGSGWVLVQSTTLEWRGSPKFGIDLVWYESLLLFQLGPLVSCQRRTCLSWLLMRRETGWWCKGVACSEWCQFAQDLCTSWTGGKYCVPARIAMKWFFHVQIARSAGLVWCIRAGCTGIWHCFRHWRPWHLWRSHCPICAVGVNSPGLKGIDRLWCRLLWVHCSA